MNSARGVTLPINQDPQPAAEQSGSGVSFRDSLPWRGELIRNIPDAEHCCIALTPPPQRHILAVDIGLATSLIGQVAAGYLADREYGERLMLARKTLANLERALVILTRRFQLGPGSNVEVNQRKPCVPRRWARSSQSNWRV